MRIARLDEVAALPPTETPSGPAADRTCTRCKRTFVRKLDKVGLCWDCDAAEKQAEAWRETAYRKAGIPARHARCREWSDLDGPEPYRRTVAAVRRFVEDGDSVLGLIGTRGTGKTQCAAVAIAQTIEGRRTARYVTASQLLADLTRRFAAGGDTENAWIAEWSRPHLLAIDEITELPKSKNDYGPIMLTALVDSRYGALRPTLLIGNVAADRFAECVGASIADRCRECGGVVRFDGWPSFRAAPRLVRADDETMNEG